MTRADRIARAVLWSPLWRPLFWLTRPIEHVRMLRVCDATGFAPITWRHVLLLRDPRGRPLSRGSAPVEAGRHAS